MNGHNLDLSVALWLATDDYAHNSEVISVTKLIKSVRQIVLASRVPEEERTVDVVNLLASRMGTAIHDSIEKSWVHSYKKSLAALGYSKQIIESVMINPSQEDLDNNPDKIPVYTERRTQKDIGGYTLSGEYDFCAEGRVEDFKSTSTYVYMKGVKDEEYRLQGSMYRWLDPETITQDEMAIQFVFTDWKRSEAARNPDYPSTPVKAYQIPLLSYEETEQWIKDKLAQVSANMDTPEPELPRCTTKDLWQDATVYKYYADPVSATLGKKSTKNFTSSQAAHEHMGNKGKGIVIDVPGKVKACNYCEGFSACTQKDEYIRAGLL